MESGSAYSKTPDGFAALAEPEREDVPIDLAAAALAIARTEYPLLDASCYLGRLSGDFGGARS